MQIKDYTIRSASLELEIKEEEQSPRIARMLLASDTPIQRTAIDGTKYFEVLDHSDGAMTARKRVPLIMDHDLSKGTIGRLETLTQKDGQTFAEVKLSRSRAGQDAMQDIQDGIRDTVSIGARIIDYKIERATKEENSIPTLRITRWEVVEASLLSLGNPADEKASIALRSTGEQLNIQLEDHNMANEEKTSPTPQDLARAERERVTEILALGATHKDGGVNDAITRGVSVDAYRAQLLERLAAEAPRVTEESKSRSVEADLSRREKEQYSVARAIQVMSGMHSGNCLEREISDELARRSGRSTNGIYVPYGAMSYRAGTGDVPEIIPTQLRADLFEANLRNNSVVGQLGVNIVPGVVGTVDIPRATQGSALLYTDEASAPTEGAYATGSVQATPKHGKAFLKFTRTLASQSTPGIEGLMRADLNDAVTEGINHAVLIGGLAGGPVGVWSTAGVDTIVVASGVGADLYSDLVSMRTEVAAANLPQARRAYVAGSRAYGKFLTTRIDDGSGLFMLQNDRIAGVPVFESNALVDGRVLYGAWEHAFVFLFGNGVELSLSEIDDGGNRKIRVFVDLDVVVRRPDAFKKINGLVV